MKNLSLPTGRVAYVPYTKKIEIGENIRIHGIENIFSIWIRVYDTINMIDIIIIILVGTVICIPWR